MAAQHLEKDILELTEALIRIPSTHSHPEKISDCTDFIAQWLDEHTISYTRHIENSVPSLVVMPSESAEIKILLLAHFDVVETESDASFAPRIEGGKLYGRGAIDDKYAVALSLILFREHLSALQKNHSVPTLFPPKNSL